VAAEIPADVCSVVDRSLAFIKHERYPDARTMRTDVRALRAGQPPPYVRAIATGKIAAGAALETGGPPSSAAGAPRSVSPTVIEAGPPSRVTQTAPDPPGPTHADTLPSKPLPKVAIAIGIAALTIGIGIGVGVGVMTCSGSDENAGLAPSDGGSREGA